MKIKSFGSITSVFLGILLSMSYFETDNAFAEPSVIVDQQCLDDGQNQYFISIQSAGFDFNFGTQDMAIYLDDFEWSYGDGIGLSSTGLYPPFFGLGEHTAIIFVEETGGPLQNHQLDEGEQFATATFTTIDCLIKNLIDDINNMNLDKNLITSLTAPLNQAVNLLEDNNPNNDRSVCNQLNAFIQKVNIQTQNNSLTQEQANQLIQQGQLIKNELGCS